MRFRMIAAAAAVMVFATSAHAATVITQGFSSTFTRYGSRGPVPIGGLNLVNQVITSAVISYAAGQSFTQNVFFVNQSEQGTYAYTGSSGFLIQGSGLPVAASLSVDFSGTSRCSNGYCSASNSISGDYIIPQADLAAFAGSGYIQIGATGGISGGVSANGGYLLQGTEFYSYASGTITYLIADIAAVPEPATWAMMILGMGAVGFAMRRHRKNVTTTVAYSG